jgi:hypothetical protein
MPKIFGNDYLNQHIGSSIKYRQRLHRLEEVEDYFIKLCKKNNIEQSIDCTANENAYYKTLNCTTYAGMFIVHPLCFSSTVFQMYDAKADNMLPGRHLGWIKSNLKKGQGTKYVQENNNEFNEDFDKDFTHVAVLPGSNKIYEHVESKKLQSLINSIGSNLVLKPHPLTTDKIIEDLNNVKGKAHLASRKTDLYYLINKAHIVYTTHISETALTGLLLGKQIEPLDPFDNRLTGAFAHINLFCFSEPDPIKTLGSIMSSPKSGIVHPDIDVNWKQKLQDYFKYTLEKREIQKGHYYVSNSRV